MLCIILFKDAVDGQDAEVGILADHAEEISR